MVLLSKKKILETLTSLKKSVKISTLLVATFLLSSSFVSSQLFAAALPSTFGYQGYFTNSSGVAQTGTTTMTVRIYDAASGGTLLFEENEGALPVVNGYFSIAIGSVGDVNLTTSAVSLTDLPFDQPYYITVALGAPYNTGEMTLAGGLRSAMNTVPYAITSAGVVTSSTSTGLLSSKGRLYYDTTLNQLFVNDGSTWSALGVAGSGITSLNGLTGLSQLFAISNAGTDASISSSGNTHTVNIPNAGATSRGVVSTTTQTFAGDKTFTGITTLATTTIANLNLTNATSTSFFSSVLTALTTIVSTLTGGTVTGGNVTATSSLVSNGTLVVTGATTLATTTISNATITNLTASNTLSASGNTLTSNIGGSSATSTIITSNTASSSANLFQTIVNGVSSTLASIINSFTQSVTGNVLTTAINGVTATTTVITSNALSTSGTTLTTTINGVATSTDLTNLVASSTSHTLTISTSTNSFTLTSIVNGKTATTTANFVNGNGLASVVNTLTSTVNGIATSTSIINSSSIAANAGVVTTIINGVTSTTSIANLYTFLASSTNQNLTIATTTSGLVTYSFTDTPIFASATATSFFASTLTALSSLFTNANITTLTAGTSTLGNASSTNLTVTNNLDVAGKVTLGDASTTNLSVSGKISLASASSTAFTASSLYATVANIDTASTSNLSAVNFSSPNISLLGAFRDSTNASGTLGQVLWSTGTSTQWVSTSSLGIVGGAGGLSGGVSGYLSRWLSPTTLGVSTLLDDGIVVGINATSSNYAFTVQGRDNINPLNVASSSGESFFSVLANGNIGVGTSTPLTKFVVNAPIGDNFLTLSAQGVGAFDSLFYKAKNSDESDNSWLAGINITTDNSYQIALTDPLDPVNNGSPLFTILNSGKVGVGVYNTNPTDTLDVRGDGITDPFKVASSSGDTLFKILANGSVGIGTSSPQALLHLAGLGSGDFNGSAALSLFDAQDSSAWQIMFRNSTVGTSSDIGFWQDDAIGTLILSSASSTENPIMSWDPLTENVGVGTSTSLAKFAVVGGAFDLQGSNTEGIESSEMVSLSDDQDFSSDTGNWTGSSWAVSGGLISHTGSNTNLILSNGALTSSPVAGEYYQITFDISTTVSDVAGVSLSFGGATTTSLYGTSVGDLYGETVLLKAVNGSSLTISAHDVFWEGSIDNVSIKRVTFASLAQSIRNSDGTIGLEFRAGGSGQGNSFVGKDSGVHNTVGTQNSFFGSLSGASNLGGYDNSFFGYNTGSSNTVGGGNSFVGSNAGRLNTNGYNNSFFGSYTGENTSVGSSNTFVGVSSGQLNTLGSSNIFVGLQAGYSNQTGNENIYIGNDSGGSNGSGVGNIFLGSSAGYNSISGDYNIILGYHNDVSSTVGSRQLNIGNLLYGTNLGINGIASTGSIGIGTSSPGSTFSVMGSSGVNPFVVASSTGESLFSINELGNLSFSFASSTGLTSGDIFSTNFITSVATTTDLYLTGGLYDSTNFLGTLGQVLWSTGTSTQWVSTSSLGIVTTIPNFFQGTSSNPTALRVMGNIDNTATSTSPPTTLATFSLGSLPVSISLSGQYAYAVDLYGNNLYTIDVSTPTNPEITSTLFLAGGYSSVIASGNYAYALLASGVLSIIDISSKTSPTVVSSTTLGINFNEMFVSGQYAYITNPFDNALIVTDVSNPKNPFIVSTTTLSTPDSLYVSDQFAYVLDENEGGLTILDISNPKSPIIISTSTTGTNPSAIKVSGRYAYITNKTDNTLTITDISSPANPVLKSTLTVGLHPSSLAIAGRYVYVTNGDDNTMSLVDVADPNSPVVVSTTATGVWPVSIEVSGRYAYIVNETSSSLSVIDLGGIESTSAIIHSLETGNLSVRGNIQTQGILSVGTSLTIGKGGFNSQGNSSVFGSLAVTGSGGIDPLVIASSSGGTLFSIDQTGASSISGLVSCGGIQTNANGTMSCTSDARLKDIVSTFSSGLSSILRVTPQTYSWKTNSGLYDGGVLYSGFIAQNIQEAIPEAVTTNKAGNLQINTTTILATVINAVKELSTNQSSSTKALSEISKENSLLNSSVQELTAAQDSTNSNLSKILSFFSLPSDKKVGEYFTVGNEGYFGVGTTHPLVMLHVSDQSATGTIARFENTSGYCDIDPTTKSLVCTTDDAQRTNIYLVDSTSTAPVASTTATIASTTLEKVTSLNVVTYTIASSTHTGLVLSDIQTLFPDLVKVDTNGTPSFSLTNLIPYIIESVKSLALQVAELKNKIITHEVHTEIICVKKTDGQEVCFNGDEVDTLLQQNKAVTNMPVMTPSIDSTSTSTEQADVLPSPTSSVVDPSLVNDTLTSATSSQVDIPASVDTVSIGVSTTTP